MGITYRKNGTSEERGLVSPLPRLVICLALVVITGGCGFTQSKNDAEAIAERYFEAAQRGDNEAVLSLYDQQFYTNTPRPKWAEMYSKIVGKLGKPTKHDLTNWTVNNMVGIGAGRYVTLVYKVTYEKDAGRETLRIFLPPSGSGGILAHNFTAPALLN